MNDPKPKTRPSSGSPRTARARLALLGAALALTGAPAAAHAQVTVVEVIDEDAAPGPPTADLETRKTLRWACVLSGAAATTAATAYLLLGYADQARVENAWRDEAGRVRGVTQAEAANLEADARTQKTFGVVGLSVGAVLLATGAFLWMTEPAETPVEAWVAPEGGGGLGVRGRF